MSAKRPGAHEPRLKSYRIRHDASDYDSVSLIEKEYRPDQEGGAREEIARERQILENASVLRSKHRPVWL